MDKIKSFRKRLLNFFLSFTITSIFLIVAYGYWYINKKDQIYNLSETLNTLTIHLIMDIKCQSDFIKYDAVDTSFFITGTCRNLETHAKIRKNIENLTQSVIFNKNVAAMGISTELDSVKLLTESINTQFEEIVSSIKLRGYKDYGIEGEMRDFAHRLESTSIDQSMLLTLRRHEKDYIIRKEPQYISKLNEMGSSFRKSIESDPLMTSPKKDSIEEILDNYLLSFNTLVETEKAIGLYQENGLTQDLESLFNKIENKLQQTNNLVSEAKQNLFKKFEVISFFFFLIILVVNVILSLYLSKYITKPLEQFTRHISKVAERNFNTPEYETIEKSDYEILILINEFNKMINQIQLREQERNAAVTAVRESENKYRDLADMLPQAVFETNLECELTYTNRTFINIFGDFIKEGRSVKVTDLLGCSCDMLINEEVPGGMDLQAIKLDGKSIPLLLYVSRIVRRNKVEGLRGIIVDMTERNRYVEELKVQKEKAEQADRLKSAFLANMSHEIRTPMNSIVGFSDFLTQPNLDYETRKEYASFVRNSSNLLLHIINDLLDLAKLESGQMKISKEYFDLNSMMGKVAIQAQELKREKEKDHLEIKISNYYASGQFMIYSDEFRLEQILINLISNAIKFTPKGIIEIGYTVNDEKYIQLFVKDSGIGIRADNVEKVFDRFIQLEETNTKQYEGAGLGLSICKSIADLLGGRIWVDSELSLGSIFFIEIPYESSKLNNSTSSNERIMHEAVDLSGKRLLVAEDVDFNYILLREGLKKHGIIIERAINGLEALEKLSENHQYDLILMDMRMPKMNGYDASRVIRTRFPSLPIIATTAYAMSGEKEKCLEAGCTDYIAKPINLNLLLRKISHQISISKSSKQNYKPVTIN